MNTLKNNFLTPELVVSQLFLRDPNPQLKEEEDKMFCIF